MMVKTIDLNCDMGEIRTLFEDGTQDRLMQLVSSVNISCGAHAGNDDLIRNTILSALRHGVAIGAHPGYPDRANFGRIAMQMSLEELSDTVFSQLAHFAAIAEATGATIAHVKPHGALYNVAVKQEDIALAIAQGVACWRKDVTLVGLAGSPMLRCFTEAGFRIAAEAFADRRYEPDGTLRSRQLPGALLTDPNEAACQSVFLASNGSASTLCIHSDTPASVAIAAKVVEELQAAGIRVSAHTIG